MGHATMEEKPKSRGRLGLAVLLGFCALLILLTFWTSDMSFGLRVELARVRGYDGCTCRDCAEAFGFGPGLPEIYCGTGRRRHRDAMRGQLLASSLPLVTVLIVAGIARTLRTSGDPLRCAGCGYDLHGLPGNRCPECGQLFDPTRDPLTNS